jgi:glutathione peroxidase
MPTPGAEKVMSMKGLRGLLGAALFAPALATAAECGVLEGASFRPLAEKEPVRLCERFGGEVLLVVNTASRCGFTPQYEGLEALHARYAAQGFAVVGFPSNDFMGQEPGSEEEIREFCRTTYGVKFPMFEKVTVKANNAVPFYRALAEGAGGEYPSWNFHKYVVDREGKVVASFGSRVKPDAEELVKAIEQAIAAPKPTEAPPAL